MRIQVRDLGAYGRCGLAGEACCLCVCHPLRDLYIPIGSWHATLVAAL